MTTIATDGRVMAADGRTSQNELVLSDRATKLHRLPDGSVIGTAGEADTGEKAVEALAAALAAGGEPPRFKGDYALLRLTNDGKVVLYWEQLIPIKLTAPAAIGSGKHLALGAMHAGAHPVDAIKIAKKLDVNSGGRTHSMKPRP